MRDAVPRVRRTGLIAAAVTIAVLLPVPTAGAAPADRVRPLPTPAVGFTPSSSSGNPVTRALIAGSTVTAAGERAATYHRGTHTVQVLGTLGGAYSAAADVNGAGDVTGVAWTASGDTHAFYLRHGSTAPRDLGTLGGPTSYAYALNSHGVVVGTSLDATGEQRAFRWDPRVGRMQDLGALAGPGAPFAAARAVNDAGDIVGESAGHAFVWQARRQRLRDLGVPGGSLFSAAHDISNAGVIVGRASSAADDSDRPVAWRSATSRPRVLSGPGSGQAEAVNGRGVIVGELTPAAGDPRRAVVWSGWSATAPIILRPGDAQDAFVYGIDSRSWVITSTRDQLVAWRPVL